MGKNWRFISFAIFGIAVLSLLVHMNRYEYANVALGKQEMIFKIDRLTGKFCMLTNPSENDLRDPRFSIDWPQYVPCGEVEES